MNSSLSMFNAIALDIAQRIVNGEFPIGTKISGRSLLAGHYNVSPETVRKAVALLKDSNVVMVSQGKEIVVESIQQAYHFLAHTKDMHSVYSLKQELELLLTQKQEIDKRLETILSDIINFSDRLKNLTPYNPIEVVVPSASWVIGKSIGEICFWGRTGATVVAVRRGTEVIISPGPSAILQPGDKIILVGSSDILQQVTDLFHTPA
jgi:K+/H+ antiporter YhaU regulatory subunit KhtT